MTPPRQNWLSTYGLGAERLQTLQRVLRAMADRAFAGMA